MAIVDKVSPNCAKTALKRDSSLMLNLQANAFAIAVTDAVSSHGFTVASPPNYIVLNLYTNG